jgi:hypothetical protein
MSRFPVRFVAALLLLAVVAAVPVLYRQAERRRQLAPFQGEWVDEGTGRPVVVRGSSMAFLPWNGYDGADCTIGRVDLAADPPRVELTVPVSGHPGERGTTDCIFRAEPGRIVVECGIRYPATIHDPPHGFTFRRKN